MWIGVTKGLALIKFSGSPNVQGLKKTMYPRAIKNTLNPNKSLIL